MFRKILILLSCIVIISVCLCGFSAFACDIEDDELAREVFVKSYVLKAFEEKQDIIDLKEFNLTKENAKLVFESVLEKNSVFLKNDVEFDFTQDGEYVSFAVLTYTKGDFSLMATDAETEMLVNQEVERILSYIEPSMTDVQKALVVHDYFVTNYDYDYTYSKYTKEDIFIDKTGVCAAYATAYQYIMKEKLDIPCIYIPSSPMNHAWNLIKIDDEWYHIDCTWDDVSNKCSHLHFMVSDYAMADEDRKHFGWVSPYSAQQTKYDDYFWKNIKSKIVLGKNNYYYITSQGKVVKRNFVTNNYEEIYYINSQWPCYNKPGYVWSGYFSGIEYFNGLIYVNTNSKVLSMTPFGTDVKTVYSQNTSNGYICGLILNGHHLIYDISKDVVDFGVESKGTVDLSNQSETDNYTYTLNEATGVLTIKGTGELNFREKDAPWNNNISKIKSVVVEDGITGLGDYVFYNCQNLESIEIPNSVTYIGYSAFKNCYKLNDVVIPESVTSIEISAFENCTSLKSIEIPNKVTDIGYDAFYNCQNLESVVLSESVNHIGSCAFEYCVKLKSIHIPEGVTKIGYNAFYGCTSLESIEIPNSVTLIGTGAFEYCTKLKDVKLGNSIEYIADALFEYCDSLESIEIPDSAQYIGESAFEHCDSLKTVIVGSGVKSIGYSAFDECFGLESITLCEGLETIDDYAFYTCSRLKEINIPNTVTYLGRAAFYKCSSLESVHLSGGLEEISPYCFTYCDALKNIIIPGKVTIIGEYSFAICQALESVEIPKSAETIGQSSFYYCLYLKDINYCGSSSEWQMIEKGTDWDLYAGYYASNSHKYTLHYDYLPSHVFGEWILSVRPTCTEAGEEYSICIICGQRTNRLIDPLGHKFVDEWFIRTQPSCTQNGLEYRVCQRCNTYEQTKPITAKGHSYPLSWQYDYSNNIQYKDCSNCAEGKISQNITFDYSGKCGENITWTLNATSGLLYIYGYGEIYDNNDEFSDVLWNDHSSIVKSVYFSDNITSIGKGVFSGCTSLALIEIPEGITEIESYAFKDCKALGFVTLPDSLTHIGYKAFGGCDNLKNVSFKGTESAQGSLYNFESSVKVTYANTTTTSCEKVYNEYVFTISTTQDLSDYKVFLATYNDKDEIINVNTVDFDTLCETVTVAYSDKIKYAKVYVWSEVLSPICKPEYFEILK